MKKTIIRIIAFLTILSVVLIYCNNVLKLKEQRGIYSMTKMYEQKKNTVDVLVVGSSHAFTNFDTGLLWDEYGISSFVLAGGIQPFWNTYHFLKEALKTQHPKLIILEGYMAIHYWDYSDSTYIALNNYGLRLSPNKIESLLVSVPKESRRDYIPDFVYYHSRYKNLTAADFLKDLGDPFFADWKGYELRTETTPTTTTDISNVTEIGHMSEKSERYYIKILELAQQNDIPIEVVIAPYAEIYDGEQVVFNRAQQIADDKGVPFTNCNLLLDDIGINYSTDALDEGHLNYKGAKKFTRFIGDNIVRKYNITDHHGDPYYQSWERQAAMDRKLIFEIQKGKE